MTFVEINRVHKRNAKPSYLTVHNSHTHNIIECRKLAELTGKTGSNVAEADVHKRAKLLSRFLK